MSSISVRFNSFSVLYSIFNEHKSPLLGFYPSGFEVPAFRCTSPIGGSRHCRVVGLDGLEPSTSRLSGVRSNHLSYKPLFIHSSGIGSRHHVIPSPRLKRLRLEIGGDDGVRTHDPLLAGQVLSQLSYTPVSGLLPLSKIILDP